MFKCFLIACILNIGQVCAQKNHHLVCFEFRDSTFMNGSVQLCKVEGGEGDILQSFYVRVDGNCSYVSLSTNETERGKVKCIQRNIIEDLIALEFVASDARASNSMYSLKFRSDAGTKSYPIESLSTEVLEDFFDSLD